MLSGLITAGFVLFLRILFSLEIGGNEGGAFVTELESEKEGRRCERWSMV